MSLGESISKKHDGLAGGYIYFVTLLQSYGLPVLLLGMRLWIARVFYLSGLTKISNWDATLFLFQSEYKVPFIPPDIAAYMSTFNELTCPVLLVLGFATRLATLPLLAMTLVIQFTYELSVEHTYWGFLLLTLLILGPGKISVDYCIRQKCERMLSK